MDGPYTVRPRSLIFTCAGIARAATCIVRFVECGLETTRGMCSEHLRATDLLGQSTSIFALKNAKGGIIASDTLTTYLASGHYHDSEYTEMLPPECIHPKGRYVLRQVCAACRSAAASGRCSCNR